MDPPTSYRVAAIDAFHRGDMDVLKALSKHVNLSTLEMPHAVNFPDEEAQQPALHVALRRNSEAMVGRLCDYGCDLEAVDFFKGQTALTVAAKNGSVGMVRLLAGKGASLAARNVPPGRFSGSDLRKPSPLALACFNGHADVVTALLKVGADPGGGYFAHGHRFGSPVFAAIVRGPTTPGHLQCVRALAEHGVNVVASVDDASDLDAVYTLDPLNAAVEHGRVGIALFMCEQGADPWMRLTDMINGPRPAMATATPSLQLTLDSRPSDYSFPSARYCYKLGFRW